MQRAFEEAGIGACVRAKGEDARDAGLACTGGEPGELRVVAIDHRGPARLDVAKNL